MSPASSNKRRKMSKVTAPLLSFEGSGQIAKTQVYGKWRGISYVRRYVIPSNPNTSEQQLTRTAFKWLQNVWRYAPALFQEPWTAYASGQPLTDRNAFGKFNISPLRAETDLSSFIMSPGAKSGPPASAVVATPGSGQLSVALTAPSLPTGWTIVEGVAACIRDQDPNTGVLYAVTAGFDASSPYTIVLTGLTSSQLYWVGGWFKYQRPDLSFAYGPSVATSATPS
jgi:hypothetical protein